jgi:hypothetical protein
MIEVLLYCGDQDRPAEKLSMGLIPRLGKLALQR